MRKVHYKATVWHVLLQPKDNIKPTTHAELLL